MSRSALNGARLAIVGALCESAAAQLQTGLMDFYFDATTMLPVVITFDAQPDNDATANLLVEIDSSNYQTMTALAVPMHIQMHLQSDLLFDGLVTGVLNSGLHLSYF